MGLKPLSEGGSVDLDDGGLGEGVGTDEFVVGRVVDDTDDTGLLGYTLRAPREVTRVEAESTEFAVAATGADKMDTLSANTSIGGLATLLESPEIMSDMTADAIGLCIRTSSCGRMPSLRQRQSVCDGSREKYWEKSASATGGGRKSRYPMIAVCREKTACALARVPNSIARRLPQTQRSAAQKYLQSSARALVYGSIEFAGVGCQMSPLNRRGYVEYSCSVLRVVGYTIEAFMMVFLPYLMSSLLSQSSLSWGELVEIEVVKVDGIQKVRWAGSLS